MKENIKRKSINEPVSDEAMERLAQIMTDSPTLVKLSKTEFAIKSLKPAVMWMIAEEAVKISKAEKETLELKVLEEYLPKTLSEEETKEILNNILQSIEATKKNFGLIMK